jgi:hypothetical protein
VHFAVIIQSSKLGVPLETLSKRIRILMLIVTVLITITLIPFGILHATLNSDLMGLIYHLFIILYILILIPSCLFFGYRLRRTLTDFQGVSLVRRQFLQSLDRFILGLNAALGILVIDTICFTFIDKSAFEYIGFHFSFKILECLAGVSMLLFTWKSKVQPAESAVTMDKGQYSGNSGIKPEKESKSTIPSDVSRLNAGPNTIEGRALSSTEDSSSHLVRSDVVGAEESN